MPRGCDYLKLPSIAKTEAGTYGAASLRADLKDVLALRSQILQSAVTGFRPDVMLVDHAPVGVEGELWPVFQAIGQSPHRPRLVLGLREVIDEAARVRADWDRLRVWSALEDVYDRVLVYGDRRVLTTADELGLPARWPGKVHFTGYLGDSALAERDDAGSGSSSPSILVTPGGGGDGAAVLDAYVGFLERCRPGHFRSIIVTGPFCPSDRRLELEERLCALDHDVELLDFVDGLDALLRRADGVISMAGYNTTVEILSARVPALVAPRTKPRREQLIRALRLSAIGELDLLRPDSETTEQIARFVAEVVAGASIKARRVHLDGRAEAARSLGQLLTHQPSEDDLEVTAL
jgi:predicted glycosyltransferase